MTATSSARFGMLLVAASVVASVLGTISRPAWGAEIKWPADEALRRGMAAIRKTTLDNHTLVTHRRMPPAGARSFADSISREANRIKSDAEVPSDAKPVLDAMLGEIVSGAEAVAGRGGPQTPIDGIVRIDAALNRYPQHFDDPTWQPLR